MAMLFDHLR